MIKKVGRCFWAAMDYIDKVFASRKFRNAIISLEVGSLGYLFLFHKELAFPIVGVYAVAHSALLMSFVFFECYLDYKS